MPLYLAPLSRRRFLARALAGSAALALAPRVLAAAARRPDPHTWALLSDTHIAADRARIAREINLTDCLTRVVQEVLDWPQLPAGSLVDGDLALGTGEAGDYATLGDLIAPLRGAGLPLTLALGNHDHRERFWAGLAADKRVESQVADKQMALVPAARANWFVLDSLDRTNVTPGVLGPAQLDWLARALDAHRDKPALVMVHHNPNTGGNKNGLTEYEALMAILRPRRHVKAHLFGHSHRWSVERDESGIHLINLPATSYPFDKSEPTGWVAAQLQPQGLRLELRALNRSHPAHGQVHELPWRA